MNVTVELSFPNETRRRLEFADPKEISIGRDPSCTVALDDTTETVSARHVVLRFEQGKLTVEDLNSSNGTFLEGRRITKSALGTGQEFGLGLRGPRVRVSFVAPTVLETKGTVLESTAVPVPEGTVQHPSVVTPAGPESRALTHVGSKTVLQMINQAIEVSRQSGRLGKGTIFIQEMVRQTVRESSRPLRWGLVAVAVLLLGLGGYVVYAQIQNRRMSREAADLIAATVRSNAEQIQASAKTQVEQLQAVESAYKKAQADLEERLHLAESARSEDSKKISALRSELLTTRERADEISVALGQTQQALEQSQKDSDRRIASIRDQSRKELKQALLESVDYLAQQQKAYLTSSPAAVISPRAGTPVSALPKTPVVAPAGAVFFPSTREALVMKKRLALERIIVGSEVESYGVSRPVVEASIRAIVSETLTSTGRFEFVERTDLGGIAQEKSLAEKGLVAGSEAAGTPLSSAQVLLGLAVTRVDIERQESTSPGWGSVLTAALGAFGSFSQARGLSAGVRGAAAEVQKANIQINDQVTDLSISATVGISAAIREVTTGKVKTLTAQGASSSTKHSYAAVMSTAYTNALKTGSVIQPKSPLAAAIADCAIRLSVQISEALGPETWRGRLVSVADSGRLVLNAGKNVGLREGDTFQLTRRGAPLKDPSSNEILGFTAAPVGVVVIESADERTSLCRMAGAPQLSPTRGDDAEFIGRTVYLKEGETREELERRVTLEGVPALLAQILSKKTKVYAAPSVDSGAAKVNLAEGQVLAVSAKFADWYQVTIEGKAYYLPRDAATEISGRSLSGIKLQVNTERVDLLVGPQVGRKKLAQLTPGTTLEPTLAVPGWYQVRLSEGPTGWVPETNVKALGRS